MLTLKPKWRRPQNLEAQQTAIGFSNTFHLSPDQPDICVLFLYSLPEVCTCVLNSLHECMNVELPREWMK